MARQELFVIDATSREPRKIDTLAYPRDMEYVPETLPLRFFRIKEELGEDSYSILYDVPKAYLNEDGTINTKVAQPYYNLDTATRDLLASLWDRIK